MTWVALFFTGSFSHVQFHHNFYCKIMMNEYFFAEFYDEMVEFGRRKPVRFPVLMELSFV